MPIAPREREHPTFFLSWRRVFANGETLRGPDMLAMTTSYSSFSSRSQGDTAPSALPGVDSSNRHAASALTHLARLLGRLAAREALKTDTGNELSDEDLRKPSTGTAR